MLPAAGSFVLLDDARPGGGASLYRDPIDIVVAHTADQVRPALHRLREAVARGHHAAGWMGYEAGAGLETKLASLGPEQPGVPLLWFGLFGQAESVSADALTAMLPDPAGAWAGKPRPRIARADYDAALGRVLDLIGAGDIYQANLSFRADVPVAGHPLALYARLRDTAGAGWGGIVHDGADWLLSFSPESFFRIDGGRIVARPMKGTALRGRTPQEDAAFAAALASDPKERAENLMIVDLIRNDLSRVAVAGSVQVPELFAVETYPTIQQMVSSVEADLAPGRDPVNVIEALFPCGSITGAPKIRSMEIIADVEADARGPYTGTIGHIGPDGTAAFNVAIRTLALAQGSDRATIGLGSAVVADSTADKEWAECLAKGAFVAAGQRPFDLIETLGFDPTSGLVDLERHIARIGASAGTFGFRFDRHGARNELHAATFRLTEPSRIRMLLSPSGAIAVECRPMPALPAEPVEVAIVPLPVNPADFRLRHKTTDRAFYDNARKATGTFEVLFERPDGFLTEGSFTSLFVERDGMLLTPPLADGLLPGTLRGRLIENSKAVEHRLTRADLADGFVIGNSARGMIAAKVAAAQHSGL